MARFPTLWLIIYSALLQQTKMSYGITARSLSLVTAIKVIRDIPTNQKTNCCIAVLKDNSFHILFFYICAFISCISFTGLHG